MALYAGLIEIVKTYVNFRPLYRFEDGRMVLLSNSEIYKLLPESPKENINFYFRNSSKNATSYFARDELIAFDFETDELEDNYNAYGDRNITGYKVELTRPLANGMIKKLSDLRYYYVLPLSNVRGNYKTNPVLVLDDDYVYEDLQVVIPIADKQNTVIGPFTVSYRETDGEFIVRTNLESSKYVIDSYKYPTYLSQYEITERVFENDSNSGIQIEFIYLDPKVCVQKTIDVISDEQLLNEFKRTIDSDQFTDGTIDLSNIGEFLDGYKQSLLMGLDIPEEIKKGRLERLSDLLGDEDNLHDTFSYISDNISAILAKYQGNEEYSNLIQQLLEDNDFSSKIQTLSIVKGEISKQQSLLSELENQVAELQTKKNESESDLDTKRQEYAEQLKYDLDDAIQTSKEELDSLQAQIKSLQDKLGLTNEAVKLDEQLKRLRKDVEDNKRRNDDLNDDYRQINDKIQTMFDHSAQKAMEFSFNGMLSNRMLRQAAEWENAQTALNYSDKVLQLQELPKADMSSSELVDYLTKRIMTIRPSYDKNTILNILICYTQGFLTVFTGEPGTGKTSICRLLAATLGETKVGGAFTDSGDGFNADRFINVSVERGWTTKRDFIGYFNPLTKTFDRSNRQIFDCLNVLSREVSTPTDLPCTILLDEANLSPMEYYWADFMNVCDQLDGNSTINLGNDYIFRIPDNLRFVATINNDHTTEALSPRLIDRAWIVKLPKVQPSNRSDADYMAEDFNLIPWSLMKKTFDVPKSEVKEMGSPAKEIFASIVQKFRSANISVSPRAEAAIMRYWTVAQNLFESGDFHPSVIALDYAIAQRILPHISGSGEKFRGKLDELSNICRENNLIHSASIIRDIVNYGDDRMQYYQFFEY